VAVASNPEIAIHVRNLRVGFNLCGLTHDPPIALDESAGSSGDDDAQMGLKILERLAYFESVRIDHRGMEIDHVPTALLDALMRCLARNAVRRLEVTCVGIPVSLLCMMRPSLETLIFSSGAEHLIHDTHNAGAVCTAASPRHLEFDIARPSVYSNGYIRALLEPCTASLFARVVSVKVICCEETIAGAHRLLGRMAPTVQHIHLCVKPSLSGEYMIEDHVLPIVFIPPPDLTLPQLATLRITFHPWIGLPYGIKPLRLSTFVFYYLIHPAFQNITAFTLAYSWPTRDSPRDDILPPALGGLPIRESYERYYMDWVGADGRVVLDCGGWARVDELLADPGALPRLEVVRLELNETDGVAMSPHVEEQARALFRGTQRVRRLEVATAMPADFGIRGSEASLV